MKRRLMIKTSTAIATATANLIPVHLAIHVGYRTLSSGNLRVLTGAGAMYSTRPVMISSAAVPFTVQDSSGGL
jgi:hypothetical protein